MVLLSSGAAMGATSVENELVRFIKKLYGGSEIQVTFNHLPQHLVESKRIKSISFSKVPDTMGDGICLVGVEGQGRSSTNVYVPFKVQIKRTLYSVKRNIKKGDTIRLDDIAVKETYLQGSAAGYPIGIEEVVGKAAKKEMLAGQIVTTQMLEEQVMVTRGETVNMTVENKRLIVQAKGIALEKGGIGDFVRVKSASGKEIIGRVTGNNSITVEF